MSNNEQSQLLFSSFKIESKMNGTIGEIRKRLDSFPSLKLVDCEKGMRYRVERAKNPERILELNSDSIRLIFYFRKPDEETFSENLMQLLTILAALDGLYEINMGSVYPYVIEALSRRTHIYRHDSDAAPLVDRLRRNVECLTFANSKLSHIIYNKARAEKITNMKFKAYRLFCEKVVETVSKGGNSEEALRNMFGIESSLSGPIFAMLKEKGD